MPNLVCSTQLYIDWMVGASCCASGVRQYAKDEVLFDIVDFSTSPFLSSSFNLRETVVEEECTSALISENRNTLLSSLRMYKICRNLDLFNKEISPSTLENTGSHWFPISLPKVSCRTHVIIALIPRVICQCSCDKNGTIWLYCVTCWKNIWDSLSS